MKIVIREDHQASSGETLAAMCLENDITVTCPTSPADGDHFYIVDVDQEISPNAIYIESDKNLSNYEVTDQYVKIEYSSGTDTWTVTPKQWGEL